MFYVSEMDDLNEDYKETLSNAVDEVIGGILNCLNEGLRDIEQEFILGVREK